MSQTQTQPEKSSADEFVDLVVAHIKAGCQLMFVPTGGQLKLALELLYRASVQAKLTVFGQWDSGNGLEYTDVRSDKGKSAMIADTANPGSLLKRLAAGRLLEKEGFDPDEDESGLILCHDLFTLVGPTPSLGTQLKRQVAAQQFNTGEHQYPVVVLGTLDVVPPALSPYVVRLDLPYPEVPEMRAMVDELLDSSDVTKNTEPNLRSDLAHLCLGMTVPDANETVATAVVLAKKVNERAFYLIEQEKAKIIRNVPGLSHVSREEIQKVEIGGYEALKQWAEEQHVAFKGKAAAKLDQPKGVLLVGPPGSGKSYSARHIARVFHLPLYMLDISSVMAGIVGESERQMREALACVSANKECVLLIDEIDKGLGGAHRAAGDSGVTKRMLGRLLTWMNDKKEKIFVVMTANRSDDLPPELLRPGRLDEVFFVDLPNANERKAILESHLRRRTVAVERDLTPVIDKTREFSGAEIERVVTSAMVRKAAREANWVGDTLTVGELVLAAESVRPISLIDIEGIAAIRAYGRTNLKSASLPEEVAAEHPPVASKKRTIRVDNPESN